MIRQKTYTEAINEALTVAMEQDPTVICYGLGTDDPKGIFGTTLGLQERFGKDRVFDMPLSENAMTGVAIGAGLNGIRTVMNHQRLDFFLLAMDQLVNNAAKWHYMFGGKNSVPITIRLVTGRGWGQGPTHSQNLQAWFAHVPGLKVVVPTTPHDAKGLLLESIFDDNPVIFIEHRWLHNMSGKVPIGDFRIPIGRAKIVQNGTDVTIVSMSYMTIEALHAIEYLKEKYISCELIDLCSVSPVDWKTIFKSVNKTGRILALDTAHETGSIAGEIVARVSMECYENLKHAPVRIALPDIPTPTTHGLTKIYYKRAEDIIIEVMGMFGKQDIHRNELNLFYNCPSDVPGDWFKGPF